MGLIRMLLNGGLRSVGETVTSVAEVFRPNATRQMELGHQAYMSALDQFSTEFAYLRPGLFDRIMNGLNRLPRPFLAIGTLGLFVFSMVDPARFAARMQGLQLVPEPLWWLLGAIVGFYFGARELHYARNPRSIRGRYAPEAEQPRKTRKAKSQSDNPALQAWRAGEDG